MTLLRVLTISSLSLLPSLSFAVDYTPKKISQVADEGNIITGFYVGINGGYGGGDLPTFQNQWEPSAASANAFFSRNSSRLGGALAGGQIGYNQLLDNQYLLGGEIDVNWANINNGNSISGLGYGAGPYGNYSNSVYGVGAIGLDWIGTGRLRLGYKLGSMIPFVSGGVAFGATSFSTSQSNLYQINLGPFYGDSIRAQQGYNSAVSAGWATGAGIEYFASHSFSIKTEYLYTQILSPSPQNIYTTSGGANETSSGPIISGGSSSIGVHQVKFGVNYHLGLFEQKSVFVMDN